MLQVIWVINYLDDLDADFLRFYRIDITEDTVDPPRFFSLASRVPAYQGVLSARIEAEREEAKTHSPSREVRDGNATEVDLSAMSDFIELKRE